MKQEEKGRCERFNQTLQRVWQDNDIDGVYGTGDLAGGGVYGHRIQQWRGYQSNGIGGVLWDW